MSDETLSGRIEQLVAQEHELINQEQQHRNDEEALAEHRRKLDAVGVELDRCWDLLRQRRALRSAGGDVENASVRDAQTVEGYLQ